MNPRFRYPIQLLLGLLVVGSLATRASAQEITARVALGDAAPASRSLALVIDSAAVARILIDTAALNAADAVPVLRPEAVSIVGGLIGGAAGFLGGAYAGDKVSGCTPGCAKKAYWGANLGMTVLLPLGVAAASGDGGSLRASLLASGAVSLAGFAAMSQGIQPDFVHIILPVAQLTAVMAARKIWK